MEYERTKEGLIQASLAKRLGIILKQYHLLDMEGPKYEVSLTLAILQNLLTNCIELFNKLSKKERGKNPLNCPIQPITEWSLSTNSIIKNTFDEGSLTPAKIFRHIRNALSHPTDLNLSDNLLSTGYITTNENEQIQKIVFVSSPDIKRKRIKQYNSYKEAEDFKNRQGSFPKDIIIEVNENSKYQFILNGIPYYRIFQIELTTMQLINLTYELSTYLSHPLLTKWDGKTFKISNIAA